MKPVKLAALAIAIAAYVLAMFLVSVFLVPPAGIGEATTLPQVVEAIVNSLFSLGWLINVVVALLTSPLWVQVIFVGGTLVFEAFILFVFMEEWK